VIKKTKTMRTLGNLLWHIPFLGFITAICTWLVGLLLTVTVVLAPVGLGLMEYGKFLFWPFGNAMVSKSQLGVEQNIVWKTYSTVVAIIFIPFGLILTVAAAFQAVALCITIIGIPSGLVIAKSLRTFFNPVNKKCVPNAVRDEIQRRQATAAVNKHFGGPTSAA
jgi:uncharacterized membrane protein YccF (DUF307 family)